MSNHLGKFKAMLNCTEDPSRGYSKLERLFHSSFLFIYFFFVWFELVNIRKEQPLKWLSFFPLVFVFFAYPIRSIRSLQRESEQHFLSSGRRGRDPSQPQSICLTSSLPPYHQEFHSEILRSRRRQRISEDPKESRSVSISKPQRSASNRVPDWNQSNRNSAYWNNPDLIPRHATQ